MEKVYKRPLKPEEENCLFDWYHQLYQLFEKKDSKESLKESEEIDLLRNATAKLAAQLPESLEYSNDLLTTLTKRGYEWMKKSHFCQGCRMLKHNTKRCSACHQVRYCSVECQRTDYTYHKTICEKVTVRTCETTSKQYICHTLNS